jgi:transposase
MPKDNSQKYITNTLEYILYNKYISCIMNSMRYTVKQFRIDFPNDDVCLDTIFENRYGDVKDCPSCGVIDTTFHRVTGRKCYACAHCGYQLHPLAQTIFHKSSTPLTDWFYAMYLFSVSKNGVAAKELERHLGVTYKTAHRMARQIRSLMQQEGSIGGGGYVVEADETYYGGVKKNHQGGRGKAPILGIVERGGDARVKVSDVASTKRVKTFFADNLATNSELHTDESRIYLWTDKVMNHQSVNHARKEYARGGVTTNSIEGFWGQIKRSIDGTYHSVSPKYLQLYVNEFVFRYNLRGAVVYPALLEQASKPSLLIV